MSDSERIKKVIEWSKMTTNEFSASLGYERAMTLYNIINEKTKISVKVCNIICNKYQQINYDWLKNGNGEMLKATSSEYSNNQTINNQITDPMTIETINKMLDIISRQQDDIHLAQINQANLIDKIPGGVQGRKKASGDN